MLKREGRSPDEIELDRILALPTKPAPDGEDCEIFSFDRVLAEAFTRGERLLPAQVACLQAYEECGGGLFPVGVGYGKTGICLMTAQTAIQRGVRKVLYLLPVHLVSALLFRHLPEWRARVPISLTFHNLAGKSREMRGRLAKSNASGVYIFPYTLLSVPDTLELLYAIDADLVLSDEVHHLKHLRAARTKRLFHWMKERDEKGARPQFVGMSGTITAKSLSDYQHLTHAALGDKSPLPTTAAATFRWGRVLNAGESPSAYERHLLRPLLQWSGETNDDQESYRNAFQKRFTSAPGIVVYGEKKLGTSLLFQAIEPRAPNAQVLSLIKKVATDYETPDGEPIDHAIHCYKWLAELTSGFYNSLVWPSAEVFADRRKLPLPEAELRLAHAKEHLVLEQEYHKELRQFFKDAPAGLDTPREVGTAIFKGKIGGPLADLWFAVKDADFAGRPDRDSIPVRVDDYKVQEVVTWAKSVKPGGIAWVHHIEMGEWVVQALKEAGIDALHCPAGADELLESVGDPNRGGKGDRIVVASMEAHATGRNLQAFQHQFLVQWPRSPLLAEQVVGRTHRTGQAADELIFFYLISSPIIFDSVNLAATLNDSIYVAGTTGMNQRVLYGDWSPLPKIFPSEFLRAQGASPQMLTESQKRDLTSRFPQGKLPG